MFGGRKASRQPESLTLQPPPGHAPDGTPYPKGLRHNRFLVAPQRSRGAWQCEVAEMDGSGVLVALQERPWRWRVPPWLAVAAVVCLAIPSLREMGKWLSGNGLLFTAFSLLLLSLAGVFVAIFCHRLLTPDLEVVVTSVEDTREILRLVPVQRFGMRRQVFHVEWLRPPAKRLASICRVGWAGGLRQCWIVEGAPGQQHTAVLTALEGPLWRAWVKRVLLGPVRTRFATDFRLRSPGGGMEWGTLHRRELIHGCHVLDVSRDWEGNLDRRVVLALAILLDLGGRHPNQERKGH